MSNTRVVYHNRAFDFVEVTEEGSNAKAFERHPGSVAIVPLLERDGQTYVVLVRQTRFATGGRLLELPAGTREEGEEAEVTARRELPEEVGYVAGRLEHLGGFYLAPGYSSEFMHVFLATELSEEKAEGDEDEVDLETELLPLAEAVARAGRGEFDDVKTVAALLMVAARGEGKGRKGGED